MATTELVPLERVRFADGAVRAVPPLPRNTLDIRYSACADHHTACDCREAMLAEDIGEYRLMFRQLEDAILAAIKGHQTYAYTADGYTDEFAQCKCPACVIARAAHVGYCEAIQARRETSERLEQDRIERERATYARMYPDLDEVPF